MTPPFSPLHLEANPMWLKLAIAASLVVPGGLIVAGVYLLYRKLAGRNEAYRRWQESRRMDALVEGPAGEAEHLAGAQGVPAMTLTARQCRTLDPLQATLRRIRSWIRVARGKISKWPRAAQ